MRVAKINSQQNFNGLYVKPSASKRLESIFENAPATLDRRIEFAKAIGTMQDKMKMNPVKVNIEASRKSWWGLKATVFKGSEKEIYTQDAMFNYDFIKKQLIELSKYIKLRHYLSF